MKVYEIIIQPTAGFGTPLKGDTIFGHLCWQIAYDEAVVGQSLPDLLDVYGERPFAVLSSAYPSFVEDGKRCYAMRAPALPMEWVFHLPAGRKERIEKRKDYKKKVWAIFERDRASSSFRDMQFLDGSGLADKMKAFGPGIAFTQSRNKIDRLTGRTGEGFSPYAVNHQTYPPATELALFVGVDPELAHIDGIKVCLERIGETGYGKDASTGLGRFRLRDCTELNLAAMGSESPNACYTLSPCVPEKNAFATTYCNPFTRFGRHGDMLAKSGNPFKNPVIMADEGAVLVPKDINSVLRLPRVGTAVTGLSKANARTVTQGYSLYIPVSMEAIDG